MLSAPVDLGFAKAIQTVSLRIHSGLFFDETAALCQWHIPRSHYLESWGDVRAYDGTARRDDPPLSSERIRLTAFAMQKGGYSTAHGDAALEMLQPHALDDQA